MCFYSSHCTTWRWIKSLGITPAFWSGHHFYSINTDECGCSVNSKISRSLRSSHIRLCWDYFLVRFIRQVTINYHYNGTRGQSSVRHPILTILVWAYKWNTCCDMKCGKLKEKRNMFIGITRSFYTNIQRQQQK